MSPAWPVDMAEVPGWGLAYVDIVRGSVRSVPVSTPSNGAASLHATAPVWLAAGVTTLCVALAAARRNE